MSCALEILAGDPVGGKRAAASRQAAGKQGSSSGFWSLRNGKMPWAKQELSTVTQRPGCYDLRILWMSVKVGYRALCMRKIILYVRHNLGHHARLSLPDLEGFSVLYGTIESFGKWDFLFSAGRMGDTWQLALCHCVNLCASPSLPAPQAQPRSSRERWVCARELPAAARAKLSTHLSTGTLRDWAVMTETSGPGSVSLEDNSDFQLFLLSTFVCSISPKYWWAFAHHVVKCFRG